MYHKCYAKLGPNLQPSLTGFPLLANAVFVSAFSNAYKTVHVANCFELLNLRMDVQIACAFTHEPKQSCFQSYKDFLFKWTSTTLLNSWTTSLTVLDLVKEEGRDGFLTSSIPLSFRHQSGSASQDKNMDFLIHTWIGTQPLIAM